MEIEYIQAKLFNKFRNILVCGLKTYTVHKTLNFYEDGIDWNEPTSIIFYTREVGQDHVQKFLFDWDETIAIRKV